ncbi:MAG TPA: hypothetical protein VMU83_20525 [Hanamia sp.]|nr:hypothetical protein [Hanamia sp.]
MKKILIFICALSLLIACNKSKDNISIIKGTASYGAGGGTLFWNEGYYPDYKIDSINGNASCSLISFTSNIPFYSGKIYTFNFSQEGTGLNPQNYGITFVVPADNYPSFKFPLNTPLIFNYYSNSQYAALAQVPDIIFTSTESIGFCDSAKVTITITNNSPTSITGNFTFSIYSTLTGANGAANGVFKNIHKAIL